MGRGLLYGALACVAGGVVGVYARASKRRRRILHELLGFLRSLFLVFMLRHKILKSKFNRPAKLPMPLGVRGTRNISFCKFPAWLCPSFLKQSILNIRILRHMRYQAECPGKVVLIRKRPFLSIFAD